MTPDTLDELERSQAIAAEAVRQWNAAGNPHLSTGAIGVARIAAQIASQRLEDVERERDEARAEVERLRGHTNDFVFGPRRQET